MRPPPAAALQVARSRSAAEAAGPQHCSMSRLITSISSGVLSTQGFVQIRDGRDASSEFGEGFGIAFGCSYLMKLAHWDLEVPHIGRIPVRQVLRKHQATKPCFQS